MARDRGKKLMVSYLKVLGLMENLMVMVSIKTKMKSSMVILKTIKKTDKERKYVVKKDFSTKENLEVVYLTVKVYKLSRTEMNIQVNLLTTNEKAMEF